LNWEIAIKYSFMATKFDKLLERVPPETKLMVSKSFDISERILDILDEKGMTQKDLANILGKRESEISKWMKGTHNFTLETISKIELALGETIIIATSKPYPCNTASAIRDIYFDATILGGKSLTADDIPSHQLIEEKEWSLAITIL